MGASLPAAARWIEATPEGVSWLGLLYGGNTVGAVFGCLLAGFYLLRVFDMATATYVAAAINCAVALVGIILAGRSTHQIAAEDFERDRAPVGPNAWARLRHDRAVGRVRAGRRGDLDAAAGADAGRDGLHVFDHPGGVPDWHRDRQRPGFVAGQLRLAQPRVALGWCQLLLAAAVAWTAFMLASRFPIGRLIRCCPPAPGSRSKSTWRAALWTILPAALLWGASFPLALAAVASPGEDAGRMVGGIYAANTAGAIAGALAFSLVLFRGSGRSSRERMLIVLSALERIGLCWRARACGLCPWRLRCWSPAGWLGRCTRCRAS